MRHHHSAHRPDAHTATHHHPAARTTRRPTPTTPTHHHPRSSTPLARPIDRSHTSPLANKADLRGHPSPSRVDET